MIDCFACSICGTDLLVRVPLGKIAGTEWEVADWQKRSMFMATVVTRHKALGKTDGGFEVFGYPDVCSQACFDKVCAEWESCKEAANPKNDERIKIGNDVVSIVFGSKRTLEAA